MNALKTMLLATTMFVTSLRGLAQEKGSLSGVIGDDKGKAIQSASITLLRAKDSSRVRTVVSDKTGHFQMENIGMGNYLVLVSSVGHVPAYSLPFEISAAHSDVHLPDFALSTEFRDLKEVAVVGKKSFIEQKADRMVINVDASPSNAGSTALDILEKTPGVTLDKDDNISLKGKQGVTVMIDNKPTYMSSAQLASYLKGLPASTLDQIEVMTNPSAKYDAAGNSGIINIKTKKNKTKGFNGGLSLTHTQGVYPKPSGSINLNYRNVQANYFLNAGAAQWEGYQELDITRKYLDAAPARTVNSIFIQKTLIHFRNPAMNLKFGMDYYLTNKTTLGFVVSGFHNEEKNKSSSDILLMDPHNKVDSMVASPSRIHTTWKNASVNLNFRHQFDSAGRELTADADYVRYAAGSDQHFDNITTYNNGTHQQTTLTGNLPSVIHIYSFKTDYTRPIDKTLKLDAGLKTSYVNTDNIAGYFNVINGQPEVDTGKTNHFLYRENINAAYLSMTKKVEKWSLQLGLRYENTNYSGHQLGNGSATGKDSSFSRSYGSLFPTAYISFQASEKHQFSLNYGRRIDRPAYQDLNPFLFFLDQYTYQAGNPYLQPQLTHNIELAHTYNSFLTTTLNYSDTRNFFTETFQQDGRATIEQRGNIGHRQNAGVAISAQLHPANWWTSILYSNLNYSKFTGILYGEELNVSAANLLLNMNNQFTFKDGWGAEISGWYRSKGVEGQMKLDPMGAASAAVSKRLLQDKASLKLSIRDIFYTQPTQGSISFQQTEVSFRNLKDTRQVSVSFSYRFGTPLKGAPERRNNGAGDEQSRVKVGSGN